MSDVVHSFVLAELMAQACTEGAYPLTLRAIVEEASEIGAKRALQEIGFDDPKVIKDVRDLRDLLSAWRDVKRIMWQNILSYITKAFLALIVLTVFVKLQSIKEVMK